MYCSKQQMPPKKKSKLANDVGGRKTWDVAEYEKKAKEGTLDELEDGKAKLKRELSKRIRALRRKFVVNSFSFLQRWSRGSAWTDAGNHISEARCN